MHRNGDLPMDAPPATSDQQHSYDVPCPRTHEFPFDVSCVDVTPSVELHQAGINAALSRWPTVECQKTGLDLTVGTVPSWKPAWPRVRTVGLAFPEAIEFLPVKEEKDEAQLETVRPAKRKPEADSADGDVPRKPTRLKPPSDALSLEDRLFYILQPPLETTLAGQELIMPFEPFPHQYEGIGWLFSQKSALLADEMGLGKTMQTIAMLAHMKFNLKVGGPHLVIVPREFEKLRHRHAHLLRQRIHGRIVDGDYR